jgi:Putative transposase
MTAESESQRPIFQISVRISANFSIEIQRDVAMELLNENGGGASRVGSGAGDEFLRRFLLHVLPDSFQHIRRYGLLGNRHRAEHLARCRELLAMPTPIPEPTRTTGNAATNSLGSIRSSAPNAIVARWCASPPFP